MISYLKFNVRIEYNPFINYYLDNISCVIYCLHKKENESISLISSLKIPYNLLLKTINRYETVASQTHYTNSSSNYNNTCGYCLNILSL